MTDRSLTEAGVRQILLAMIEKRTQASLAAEIGISRSFLNEVIRGTRPPTGEILRFLNLDRRVVYVKKGDNKMWPEAKA